MRAKAAQFDVFNALDVMENKKFLEKQKKSSKKQSGFSVSMVSSGMFNANE